MFLLRPLLARASLLLDLLTLPPGRLPSADLSSSAVCAEPRNANQPSDSIAVSHLATVSE